jgi:hypothetical protein
MELDDELAEEAAAAAAATAHRAIHGALAAVAKEEEQQAAVAVVNELLDEVMTEVEKQDRRPSRKRKAHGSSCEQPRRRSTRLALMV